MPPWFYYIVRQLHQSQMIQTSFLSHAQKGSQSICSLTTPTGYKGSIWLLVIAVWCHSDPWIIQPGLQRPQTSPSQPEFPQDVEDVPFSGAGYILLHTSNQTQVSPMSRKALSLKDPGSSGSSGLFWDILVLGANGQCAGMSGTQLLALKGVAFFSAFKQGTVSLEDSCR